MAAIIIFYPLGPRQDVFKNASRRRKEADFGAKNTSASLPAATALATILERTLWAAFRAVLFCVQPLAKG